MMKLHIVNVTFNKCLPEFENFEIGLNVLNILFNYQINER
jgi:hypothetical protein